LEVKAVTLSQNTTTGGSFRSCRWREVLALQMGQQRFRSNLYKCCWRRFFCTRNNRFHKCKRSDLVGSGIVVAGKKVDFFDSANGSYTGNADYSVDLNGARTPEKIVDAIVSAMKSSATSTATGVYFSKTDTSKLLFTNTTAGAAGNMCYTWK
jgi:hypothetical protein